MKKMLWSLALFFFVIAAYLASSSLRSTMSGTSLAFAAATVSTPCPVGIVCRPTPTPTPCISSTAAGCPSAQPTRNPNATPTPCPPTVPGCTQVTPNPRPTPCYNAAGLPCKQLPDLTARPPVRIGNPSHAPIPATMWGGALTLTGADAVTVNPLNGRCAFDIWYILANIGPANAGAFKDVIKVDGTTVGIQGMPGLAAGASHLVMTQAYLPSGAHSLTLDINSPVSVAESNYLNNHFALRYTLTGACTD